MNDKDVLKEGEFAPDFNLKSDEYLNKTLADFKGNNIVLFFYPRDNTPGCTTEANDFKDLHDEFKSVDTVIIGISKDSAESHEKFKQKYDFPFTLLADTEAETCNDYDVWREKNLYGRKFMGIERSSFLIDKDAKIAKVWRKVKVKGHAQEVLEAAKSL